MSKAEMPFYCTSFSLPSGFLFGAPVFALVLLSHKRNGPGRARESNVSVSGIEQYVLCE
jgi:hypothetical protein